MLNVLLISAAATRLILAYGACAAVIFIGWMAIGAIKHREKREMRVEAIKAQCEKAKEYAQKLLLSFNAKKTNIRMFNSGKLMRLNTYVEEAMWLASQVADVKKDLIFGSIAGNLESIANRVDANSSDGYITEKEYKAVLEKTIEELEKVSAKLDSLIVKQNG